MNTLARGLTILALSAPIAATAADWRVFDLGSPDERVTEIRIAAINDRGEIAGGVVMATPSGPPERASFIYSRSGFHLFGHTTTQPPTVARDINRAGVVVGADSAAFVHDEGLARLPGMVGFSVANAVSDRGTVSGTMETPAGWRAFEHVNGVTTDLGTLGGNHSEAYGINRRGDIVGHARTASGSSRAFVKPNGGEMIQLPSLGGFFSSAYAINDRGHVVGAAQNENLAKAAFLFRDGAMIDLGTLPGFSSSDATGVNDRDHVVGIAVGTPLGVFTARPVLWKDGEIVNLAALPELAAAGFTSWVLRGELVGWNGGEGPGIAINDRGQIAGVGLKAGRPRLFVLSPR